ncbi:spore germination protein GerPC [Robertmurraya sp.]|uniref:spore germination protein GerPC n=1 Tax=Robertmurraya sp. TaxID=2837525 RepID=UPI003703BC5B
MYYQSEWIQYVQQLQSYMQAQSMKMEEMNRMIQQLIGEINDLKKTGSPPPVIRNEYKFDLLKVEKLEGTLNIGISPNGKDSSIDELDVDQVVDVPEMWQQQPEMDQRIQQQIHQYLDVDAYQTLKYIEQENQYPLDEPYRKFIVEDVKKQIHPRIQHYMKKVSLDRADSERITQAEKAIVQKVKKDIDKTFEAFIKNLPRKEKAPK